MHSGMWILWWLLGMPLVMVVMFVNFLCQNMKERWRIWEFMNNINCKWSDLFNSSTSISGYSIRWPTIFNNMLNKLDIEWFYKVFFNTIMIFINYSLLISKLHLILYFYLSLTLFVRQFAFFSWQEFNSSQLFQHLSCLVPSIVILKTLWLLSGQDI